jgi:hypothetical protein
VKERRGEDFCVLASDLSLEFTALGYEVMTSCNQYTSGSDGEAVFESSWCYARRVLHVYS